MPTPESTASATGENVTEALIASTALLMAAYAALGRCATTARGAEREAIADRVVDNLALVDALDSLVAPPLRQALRGALAQWRELASRRGIAAARPADAAHPGARGARLH